MLSDGVKYVGMYEFVDKFYVYSQCQMSCSSTTVIIHDGGCNGVNMLKRTMVLCSDVWNVVCDVRKYSSVFCPMWTEMK